MDKSERALKLAIKRQCLMYQESKDTTDERVAYTIKRLKEQIEELEHIND